MEVAKLLDIIDEYHVTWELCVSLLPLSILFVCMLCTGFFSLSLCSVPIVTVFKNLTNIIIVTGDVWIFNERISTVAMGAVAAMSLGALMLGFNDMDFNIKGYIWMTLHIISTAGMYICVHMCICVYIWMFISMGMCVYIYLYIHLYTANYI